MVDVSSTELGVDLGEADALGEALTQPDVRLGNDGEPLLVLPGEVGDVAHGDGQHGPAGTDAQGEGEGSAEDDAAVAGDDAAGHGGDEDVDGTGHELLAALPRGCQGRNGAGEGLLEVEGLVHGLVDLVLGGDGILVQCQTRLSDVNG